VSAPDPEGAIDFSKPPEEGSLTIGGLVLGIGEATPKANGKVTRRFTLANVSGVRSFTWDAASVSRLVVGGLRAGRVVRIGGVRPWRHPASGDILFFDSPSTRIEVLANEWAGFPDDPEA
jgi:hypothetical protein